MKAYIVEDENLANNRLKQLILDGIHDLDIIGESQTGKKAIKEINSLKPELIFLDIQLLDMTGFKVFAESRLSTVYYIYNGISSICNRCF